MGQIKKSQQVYLGEKEKEKISAIRNTVIYDAENLGLVPVLEPFLNFFSNFFELSSITWNNGFSRNHVLKLQSKLGIFSFRLTKKVSEIFTNSCGISKFTKVTSSQFEWTLHNRRHKVFQSCR